MKRHAGDAHENRVNFENARRILFGEEKLDRVDRERWTTAGIRKTSNIHITFPLGPFIFKVYSALITFSLNGSDYHKLAKINGDYLQFKYILPNTSRNGSIEVSNIPECIDRTYNYGRKEFFQSKSSLFERNGILYFNGIFANGAGASGERSSDFFEFKKVLPTDRHAFDMAYDSTKQKRIRSADVRVKEEVIRTIQIAEGYQYFDDMAYTISQESYGVKMYISMPYPWDRCQQLFPSENRSICSYKNKHYWFQSDLEIYALAIDWLMHVLTGPDPANYASGRYHKAGATKEESEPTKHYFEFRDGKMINTQQRGNSSFYELTFFTQETSNPVAEAYVVRDSILRELDIDDGPLYFANNLESFLKGELELESGKTLADFNAALNRIERYEQFEYMGIKI